MHFKNNISFIASSIWLVRWSDYDDKNQKERNCTTGPDGNEICECYYPNTTANSTSSEHDDMRYTYLGVYGLFGLGQAIR